jgi:hypothetical protein
MYNRFILLEALQLPRADAPILHCPFFNVINLVCAMADTGAKKCSPPLLFLVTLFIKRGIESST